MYLGFNQAVEENPNISKEQLNVLKEKLLFHLTPDNKDTTYDWYKDRVESRAANTCLWFLEHENFQKWINQESGPLLVTADPGCGKSVLAKYLIDHELPKSATTCYFFFQDEDQNTTRRALCALLHQLFTQKPGLIRHAMPQFKSDGKRLLESTASLWKILQQATRDPEAGSVVIVLDALNECAELEFEDLIHNVEAHFQDGFLSNKIKYLFTCRPYGYVVSQFQSLINQFPHMRVSGEEESDAMSREIDHVITHRMNQLSAQKGLAPEVESSLTIKLQSIHRRTYLWVHLIFEHLEEGISGENKAEIESTIATLPNSVSEAYEHNLNKSKEHQAGRKILRIVSAAKRPLSLPELNVAVNLVETSPNTYSLDLEDTESFNLRIRSLCGLLIAIHGNRVYFRHQTAREFFLLQTAREFFLAGNILPTTDPLILSLHRSISLRQARTTLAELCVMYLDLFDSNDDFSKDIEETGVHTGNFLHFLDYAAKYWTPHFNEAGIEHDSAILPMVQRICDPRSKSHSLWIRLMGRRKYMGGLAENATGLTLASYFGLTAVAKLCLEKGSDIEAVDKHGNTPLLSAALGGCNKMVEMLLEEGANVEAKDTDGRTPLLRAALERREDIVKMLLEKGANVDATDNKGWTPLQWAVFNEHKEAVKMLLEKGAAYRTLLQKAVSEGHEGIVKILRENGAELDAERSHSPFSEDESWSKLSDDD